MIHIAKQREIEALNKIERKLEAINLYVNSGNASFTVPSKFSINWFHELNEGDLQRTSKSAKVVKEGEPLKDRVKTVLDEAQAVLEASKKGSSNQKLKQENDLLKLRLKNQNNAIEKLLRDNADLKRQLGIQQARWEDLKTTPTVLKMNPKRV